MSQTHLYIDYSHICFRVLFSLRSELGKIDNIEIIRHVILKNVFHLIDKFNPTFVVVACDHGKSWRKKFYEGYKSARREKRDKDDGFNWKEFYEFISNLAVEMRENFPFTVLSVPYLEADDIIAYMVRANPNVNKVMVTSDSDYVQLLKYENTKLYDPIKKLMINKLPYEAELALTTKILMGDKSDSISSIEPRLGPKTAMKMIDSGELDKRLLEEKFKEKYELNSKLIDLTRTPRDLINILEKQLSDYVLAKPSGIFQYFVEKGLRDFLSKTNEIVAMVQPLTKSKETMLADSQVLFS